MSSHNLVQHSLILENHNQQILEFGKARKIRILRFENNSDSNRREKKICGIFNGKMFLFNERVEQTNHSKKVCQKQDVS